MGNEFQVKIDGSDVEQKLKKLDGIKDGAPRAMMRAFNKTVTGMKTDAAKEIALRYTVSPQREVKDRLETDKASLSNLSAALHSKGRPIRSIKFQHRANRSPGRKGASPAFLRAMKNGSGGKLTGESPNSAGFMATMPNGMKGIFHRTGDKVDRDNLSGRSINGRTGKSASRYARRTSSKQGRENIEQVHSPGVVQMLNNLEVREVIPAKATERFNKALDHEVDYLLKG